MAKQPQAHERALTLQHLLLSPLVVLGVVAAVLWLASTPSGLPVHYLIKDGFRGPFRIVVDPDGEELVPEGGRYVVRVPRSGYVRVKNLAFLSGWHSVTAQFENGKTVATFVTEADGDKLALIWDSHVSSTDPDQMGFKEWEACLVGTWKQAYVEGGLAKEPVWEIGYFPSTSQKESLHRPDAKDRASGAKRDMGNPE